jgi:hypothetical protein
MKITKTARLLLVGLGVLIAGLGWAAFGGSWGSAANSQARLASSQPLSAIEASNASVTKSLDASDLEELRSRIGKEVDFQGTVANVFSTLNNRVTILNFAANFRNAAAVVIHADDYAKFPDVRQLKGQRLLVTGTLIEHTGTKSGKSRLEVRVSDPAQLQLIH